MNTTQLKNQLASWFGGTPADWKRHQKFAFASAAEFEQKEFNNCPLDELKFNDAEIGTMPSAGICRVFVGYAHERDMVAHVFTDSEDQNIVYVSMTGD